MQQLLRWQRTTVCEADADGWWGDVGGVGGTITNGVGRAGISSRSGGGGGGLAAALWRGDVRL